MRSIAAPARIVKVYPLLRCARCHGVLLLDIDHPESTLACMNCGNRETRPDYDGPDPMLPLTFPRMKRGPKKKKKKERS